MTTPDTALPDPAFWYAIDEDGIEANGSPQLSCGKRGKPAYTADHLRPLIAELERLRAQVAEWESKLTAVMPADFKDWHQNSKAEWPALAADVIRSQREDRDLGWEMAARAQVAPAGWKLVPVEPTSEMIDAGRWSEYGEETSRLREVDDDEVAGVWALMLAASPAAPAQQAEPLTDDLIRACWKAWPRQGITSADKAVEFVRYAISQAQQSHKETTHD